MAKAGAGSGLLEGAYRALMRRNSVYIAFILTGALVGERVLDYGMNKIWEQNNIGKRFEDIRVLGSRASEEE